MDFAADLAKQRRKNSWGEFEVSKNDFCLYFFFWCIFSFGLIYSFHAVQRHARLFLVHRSALRLFWPFVDSLAVVIFTTLLSRITPSTPPPLLICSKSVGGWTCGLEGAGTVDRRVR